MTESNIPSQLFYAYKSAAVFTAAQTVEKHLVCLKMGSQGLPPPTGSRGGSPSKIPLSPERGQFGMDAEIRTHQALHEAKPSECPKGDRDSELEICFKKDFFYNLSRSFHFGSNYCYIFSAILSPISEQDSFVIPPLMMSPVRKPSFNTLLTAFSTASASFTISKL